MLSEKLEGKLGISHSYEQSMEYAQEHRDRLTPAQYEALSALVNSSAAEGSFVSRAGIGLFVEYLTGSMSRKEYVEASFALCREMEAVDD